MPEGKRDVRVLTLAICLLSTSCFAEALENVNPAKRYAQCAEYLSDHAFIGKAVKHGRDCDQMKDWTKNIEGVQEERRTKILRLLDEACSAEDVEAWFDGYYRKCMQ